MRADEREKKKWSESKWGRRERNKNKEKERPGDPLSVSEKYAKRDDKRENETPKREI